jgi:predicted dehydrogenase
MDKIRVGIIGASPERGWAATAHIPALRALPEYELTAVGTSRTESAQEAARRFGAEHAFADAPSLAAHPSVDLVVVTVKVPHHLELGQAALDAGKHLLIEWPLTATTEQAETLLAQARTAGVRHVVGLQARFSPAVNLVRKLIAEGYVGRVTSVTVLSALTKGDRERIPAWTAYTYDKTNAAGALEVSGGHTLDALEYLLDDRLTDLSVRRSVQRPTHTVDETGATIEVTSPDQILLHAAVEGGAVVSAHIHEGKVTQGRTRIEIAGTEGDLVIETTGGYGIQISDARVLGSRGLDGRFEELPLPGRVAGLTSDLVGNVAALYTALAADLRARTTTVPDFETGLHAQRILDALRR